MGSFRAGPFVARPEWIDENGHVNLAYYVVMFDWATDAMWRPLGLGEAFRAGGHGTFAVETHTIYAGEVRVGESVEIRSAVVGADGKRLHVAHEMATDAGVACAQQELMYLCVDLGTRRSASWPAGVEAGLRAAVSPAPAWCGRRVGLRAPRA